VNKFCFIQEGASENRTRWQSAKLVLSKVAVFYEKANIPIIAERKACEKMIALLDANAKIRAIPVSRRSSEASLGKAKAMKDKLNTTFPLWPSNAEKLMKNQEGTLFLQSMKSDRQGSFGPFDKALAEKVRRWHARNDLEARRRDKVKQEMSPQASVSSPGILDEDKSESCSDNSSDADVPPPVDSMPKAGDHHCKSLSGTSAFIPHDILKRSKLVELATHLKITPGGSLH